MSALASFVRGKLSPRQGRALDELAGQCPVSHCRACGPDALLAPCFLNEGEIMFLCDRPQVRRQSVKYSCFIYLILSDLASCSSRPMDAQCLFPLDQPDLYRFVFVWSAAA